MSDNISDNIFRYYPFQSFVQANFWYKLTNLKLDVDKLNDAPKNIIGHYTNSNGNHCLLELDYSAFNKDTEQKLCVFPSHGILYNKNTLEEFRSCDKVELLRQEGERLWNNMVNGECLKNPNLLSTFLLLTFSDLKKYDYYYWFAFPVLYDPILKAVNPFKSITDCMSSEEINEITKLYFSIGENEKFKSFFILEKSTKFIFHNLNDLISYENIENNFEAKHLDNFYFCFSDPSSFNEAGWPLRNFLILLIKLCPQLHGKVIKILSIRVKNCNSLEKSVIYNVCLPVSADVLSNSRWVGWELNNNRKYLPRLAALRSTLDPTKLAESSINLNLKLMKWRLLPNLNLSIISSTKCLLMGAGTLGCSVARNLLGWGINIITFIDNGHVSYSNPVRQTLFTHDDAVKRKDKATTAADRLKEINPGINAKGYKLHVPMPGHTIGASMMQKTIESLNQLETLIKDHDVIFLLTDSRESRWLPTLLGAYYNKIVINSALGFDSYLVMRHGCRRKPQITPSSSAATNEVYVNGLKCIRGDQLGCYFCNDITAPGNSMKDRTLDQQCTVTRPGVSNIAGSLAVELLISILQHEIKELCPAYVTIGGQMDVDDIYEYRDTVPEGILGIIPHSIRGSISTFDQILPATERFSQCIACSDYVLDKYASDGIDFLLKVFETTKYLEDITGITKLINQEHEIIEFSGSDVEFIDSD